MMNKSGIDWCDFTWNPATGCPKGCVFCYARKQAGRFKGDVRLNKASPQIQHTGDGRYILEKPFKGERGQTIPFPVYFEPTFHKYRLPDPARKKKPANIFVCSMGDLMAPCMADWRPEIFKACEAAPWHNYLFLTKYPETYLELAERGELPTGANFWYGTTVMTPDTEYFWHNDLNTFISIEPILAPFDYQPNQLSVKWVIVGAETGNQKTKTSPERSWLEAIVKTTREAGIPLLMKRSDELKVVWGKRKIIQQFPASLQRPEDIPTPHCKECPNCTITERCYDRVHDQQRNFHICGYTGTPRAIPGRYARTSPLWCPRRKGEEPGCLANQ